MRVTEDVHVRLQARDAPLEERRPDGLRERRHEQVPFLRHELGPRHEVREGHERQRGMCPAQRGDGAIIVARVEGRRDRVVCLREACVEIKISRRVR